MAKRITPTGKRMYVYEGTGYPLVAGKAYAAIDFAEATGINPATIQSRFKHRNITRIVRDCDLYAVRSKVNRCRMIEYQGNHPDLVSGNKYTYVQIGKAFNISDSFIRNRMRGHKIFIDLMASKDPKDVPITRCETKGEELMSKWLRRKIV